MITWTSVSMFVSASLIRSRNSYKPTLYTSRPDLNCSLRPASHSGEKQNFCLAAIVTATSHMYDAGSLVSAGCRFMRLLPHAECLLAKTQVRLSPLDTISKCFAIASAHCNSVESHF